MILPDSLPLDTLLIDDEPKKKAARAGRGGRGARGIFSRRLEFGHCLFSFNNSVNYVHNYVHI